LQLEAAQLEDRVSPTTRRRIEQQRLRDGGLRERSPELACIRLRENDLEPLSAFPRSLTEEGN